MPWITKIAFGLLIAGIVATWLAASRAVDWVRAFDAEHANTSLRAQGSLLARLLVGVPMVVRYVRIRRARGERPWAAFFYVAGLALVAIGVTLALASH